MAFNDNPYSQQQQPQELFPSLWGSQEDLDRGLSSCLARVFMRMFAALLVTAGVAFGINYYLNGVDFWENNFPIFIGIIVVQFVIVLTLSFGVMKMSPVVSNIMFFIYAASMGATLSIVFIAYELGTIFQAFAISALMFGAMAIYGTITRRDLTRIGSLCFMGLIGIILASLLNMLFFRSDMMAIIVNYIGVLVFVGLTAYDTQRIKRMLAEANEANQEEAIKKISVMGALILYLDFINLFLKILAILGRRK